MKLVNYSSLNKRFASYLAPQALVFLGVLISVLLLSAIIFRQSLAFAYDSWGSYSGYNHGALVVLVWIVLLIRLAPSAGSKQIGEKASILLFTFLAFFILFFLYRLSVILSFEFAQQITMASAIMLAVFLTHGGLNLGQALILLAFLFCGLPVWDSSAGFLQEWTVSVTQSALSAINMPSLVYGPYVEIPSGTFVIAEGCSGLRYSLAALAIATFYAATSLHRTGHRLVIVVLAISLSLIANWVRVISIVWIGHVTEMKSALIDDHYFFGWVLFGIALVPIFLIGRVFENREFVDAAA